jgi:hypothetical protein
MAVSRQGRLRSALQADLANLPDRPQSKPELESESKEEILKQNEPTITASAQPRPLILDVDSDSEIEDQMEMLGLTDTDELRSVGRVDDEKRGFSVKSGTDTIKDENKHKKLVRGALAPIGESFVPIISLSKFPYKYIPKNCKEDVADAFFNAGKFWTRSWDL